MLLTLKLATILAIASPSSASDIINLDFKNFSKHPNVYVFSISKFTKIWRKGKGSRSILKSYNFPSEESVCICRTLDS